LDQFLSAYPKFRKVQVYQAIFGRLIADWEQASSLPLEIRQCLSEIFPLYINHELVLSADEQTAKAIITFDDGAAIESVLMRHKNGRDTICVSSQVGCSLGCAFCATGTMGLIRDLTWGEITAQVLLFARWLYIREGERVTNVVFMGMGEPFLNYGNVLSAARFINRSDTFAIGARKISISTIGIAPQIRQLAGEPEQFNLSISLHAPNDQLRQKLMPAAQKYPLNDVLSSVREYINLTNRKVMIEYLLLDGVNDRPEQARELAALLKKELKKLFMVNLLTYNPTGGFLSSPPERAADFKDILIREGVEATRRYPLGLDIRGACGQLAGRKAR